MAQPKRWEEVTREIAYKKYSQTVERRDYKLPDGKTVDFYIRVEDPGACILALTEDNRVITLVQYRPGPNAIFRELPGGKVDAGEDPHNAAMRELLEETGYAGDIEEWIGTWENDAYTEMHRTVVVARNCKKVGEQTLEGTEFGVVELVEIEDFIKQVRAGKLTDTAGALLALDHLGLLI